MRTLRKTDIILLTVLLTIFSWLSICFGFGFGLDKFKTANAATAVDITDSVVMVAEDHTNDVFRNEYYGCYSRITVSVVGNGNAFLPVVGAYGMTIPNITSENYINYDSDFNYAAGSGISLMQFIEFDQGTEKAKTAYEYYLENQETGKYVPVPGIHWGIPGFSGIWQPVRIIVNDGTIVIDIMTKYKSGNTTVNGPFIYGSSTVTLLAENENGEKLNWANANNEVLNLKEDITYGWENGEFVKIGKTKIVITDEAGNQIGSEALTVGSLATLTKPAVSAGEVFLGWQMGDALYSPDYAFTVTENMEVTAAVVDFSMVAGASIKVLSTGADASGIRFTYKIRETDWAAYSRYIVGDGVLLLPTEYIKNTDFVIDNFTPNVNIIKGERSAVAHKREGEYLTYAVVMIKLYESNYAREFSARGYLVVDYADRQGVYVYTDYNEEDNSRSIYNVATLCKNNANGKGEYEGFDEVQKSVIDSYIEIGAENLTELRLRKES